MSKKKEYTLLEVLKSFEEVVTKNKDELKDLGSEYVCRTVEIAELMGTKNSFIFRAVCTIIDGTNFIIDEPAGISRAMIKSKAREKQSQVDDGQPEKSKDDENTPLKNTDMLKKYISTLRLSEYFVYQKYKTTRGRTYDCFKLTQKGFILVLAQYSVDVRIALTEFVSYKDTTLNISDRTIIKNLFSTLEYNKSMINSVYGEQWMTIKSHLETSEKLLETGMVEQIENIWTHIMGNIEKALVNVQSKELEEIING